MLAPFDLLPTSPTLLCAMLPHHPPTLPTHTHTTHWQYFKMLKILKSKKAVSSVCVCTRAGAVCVRVVHVLACACHAGWHCVFLQ